MQINRKFFANLTIQKTNDSDICESKFAIEAENSEKSIRTHYIGAMLIWVISDNDQHSLAEIVAAHSSYRSVF